MASRLSCKGFRPEQGPSGEDSPDAGPRHPGRGRAAPRRALTPGELAALAYLAGAAPGPRSPAVVSNARMASDLGFSVAKAKYVKRALREAGLLEVEGRFSASGARLESACRLTRAGRRELARARGPLG